MLNSMNNPLKVALMSISPHNRAILEFFFAGAGKKIFTTVAAEQAEALIIDFDHPGGRQEWQEQNAISVKPSIVISVKETVEDHIVWVPKPLTSKALAEAAEKIREMMPAAEASMQANAGNEQNNVQQAESAESIASLRALLDKQAHELRPFGLSGQQNFKAPPSPPVTPVPGRTDSLIKTTENEALATDSTAATGVEEFTRVDEQSEQLLGTDDVYIPQPLAEADIEAASGESHFQLDASGDADDPIKQEQRWERLCGREETVSRHNWHESMATYMPENYLLNSLVDALNLSHQSKQYVQVEINDEAQGSASQYVLLMPDVNLAYSSMELMSDEFAMLCDMPLKTGTVQLHLPSTTELAALEETIKRDAERTYDMEALIWTTSLLTSRGRLSRNADLTQPLRLRHWPNLTRVEHFPHVMQIAAAWQQNAGTVFDVSDWFDIPQRYVIAFYNAAHTLSLFGVERTPSPQAEEKPAPRKNRGLFSRLLKRLLGGGAK